MNIFQVGVCKGNDDLTEIIKDKNVDLLVLVEPLDIHNEDINLCYQNIENKHLENIAICVNPEIKSLDFFYHKNDGPLYEVASTNKWHIIKHGYDEENIIQQTVPCKTINKLFDEYSVKKIDILFIDAEGMDDYIIYSINFENYEIDKIYFENLHLNTNVFKYLDAVGYEITMKTGKNGWTSLASKK